MTFSYNHLDTSNPASSRPDGSDRTYTFHRVPSHTLHPNPAVSQLNNQCAYPMVVGAQQLQNFQSSCFPSTMESHLQLPAQAYPEQPDLHQVEVDYWSNNSLSTYDEQQKYETAGTQMNYGHNDNNFMFSEQLLPQFPSPYNANGQLIKAESLNDISTNLINISNASDTASNFSESSQNGLKRKSSSDSEYFAVACDSSSSPRRSRERGTKQPRYMEIENQVLVESQFMLSFQEIFRGNKVIDEDLKTLYDSRLKRIEPNKQFISRDGSALSRHYKSLKCKEKDLWKYVDTKTEFGMHLSAIEELVRKQLSLVQFNSPRK